ncbi:hypothetical protein DIPPA_28315 [Diplonema papillatum]|nr:hypothetical protein DIPPA_28315 [Diplonema papillatum]
MAITVDASSVMHVEDDVMVIPLPAEAEGKIVRLHLSGGKVLPNLKITNWTCSRCESVQCADVPDDDVLESQEVRADEKTLLLTLSDKTLGQLSSSGSCTLTLIDMLR